MPGPGNHAYGMQQGFSMAHNGHPHMGALGIGGHGGRHMLMNLAAAPATKPSLNDLNLKKDLKKAKDAVKKDVKKVQKKLGKDLENAAAAQAEAARTLD